MRITILTILLLSLLSQVSCTKDTGSSSTSNYSSWTLQTNLKDIGVGNYNTNRTTNSGAGWDTQNGYPRFGATGYYLGTESNIGGGLLFFHFAQKPTLSGKFGITSSSSNTNSKLVYITYANSLIAQFRQFSVYATPSNDSLEVTIQNGKTNVAFNNLKFSVKNLSNNTVLGDAFITGNLFEGK
jgi:hypothetical protein